MIMERIPGHEEFYKKELNIVERLAASLSPHDDFLRLTNILLHKQNELMEALGGQPGGGGVSVPGGKLAMRTEQLIKNNTSRSTEMIIPEKMAQCWSANRVLVVVNNTLDQDVRVDIIGNNSSGFDNAYIIKQILCPTTKSRVYSLKLEEWMPWVGVRVQASTAPTAGSVSGSVIIQE